MANSLTPALGYLPEAQYNDTRSAEDALRRLLDAFAANYSRPQEASPFSVSAVAAISFSPPTVHALMPSTRTPCPPGPGAQRRGVEGGADGPL